MIKSTRNIIICQKVECNDYYIYYCINEQDQYISITSRKSFDVGFIIHNDVISSRQYRLEEQIYLYSVMQLIQNHLIHDYIYENIFHMIKGFVEQQINLAAYIKIELALLKYIGYELEYTKCYKCGLNDPKYISVNNWKGICNQDARGMNIVAQKDIHNITNDNIYNIATVNCIEQFNLNSFKLIESFLMDNKINSEYREKITKFL